MNKNNVGLKVLGTATRSNIPKYAWKTVTDPDEIKEIDKAKTIEFNKRLLLQSILQLLTFAMGFGSCYYLVMTQTVQDAHWNGYGKAYKTYCTGTCLSK